MRLHSQLAVRWVGLNIFTHPLFTFVPQIMKKKCFIHRLCYRYIVDYTIYDPMFLHMENIYGCIHHEI